MRGLRAECAEPGRPQALANTPTMNPEAFLADNEKDIEASELQQSVVRVEPMTCTSESTRLVTPADELFAGLDGTSLDMGDRTWHIEVCGVHTHGVRNWIQLNLLSGGCYSVIVSVDHLDAPKVSSILRTWLSSASSSVGTVH
jgi:hypothetical protein